jgi:hypothetical protein
MLQQPMHYRVVWVRLQHGLNSCVLAHLAA